ncbi:MAG: glycoside hydrolase family 2 TIM barrel-domain containing protein [Terracidiphilus sp.]
MNDSPITSPPLLFTRIRVQAAAAMLCAAMLPAIAWAQSGASTTTPPPIVLTGADLRPAISLDGEWHAIVDPYFGGIGGYWKNQTAQPGDTRPIEYNFAKAPTLKVPGDWNMQREKLFYYEGPVWYEREFNYQLKEHTRVFLHIGAANYRSYFWVNAQKVCEHEGGFTSFNCDVTSALKAGTNFVVAAVDSTRLLDGVPTLKTDWWNYGGLTRSVSLIELPEAFIDQYDVHLRRGDGNEIEGWVHLAGALPGKTVEVEIPELGAKSSAIAGDDDRAAFHFSVQSLERWSPETPKLYTVVLRAGEDRIEDRIGFRTIEVRGTEILLNGKPVFLRGICIHGEAPYRTGRANTDKDAETLLGWAKEMGANFVRLAHYPHDEKMLRAADRMGLMVWSESPVYWAIQWDKPEVLAKATLQLDEEIDNYRNHASIVLWSMANETPNKDERTQFLTKLINHAREVDPTRLITAALLVRNDGHTKVVDDSLGNALDVIGTNEYIGWYEQTPAAADTTQWRIAFDKPLIMSEFGGEAVAGLHGAETERWTEEYQANIYHHQIVMLNSIPQLRGTAAWLLVDFRSPLRNLDGMQDGFNRKGLISDQGKKKLAFFVLQKAYTEHTLGKPE